MNEILGAAAEAQADGVKETLANCSIGDILARRILIYFVSHAIRNNTSVVEMIEADPYILIDVPGFSLSRADKVAAKFRIPNDDPRRIAAVIRLYLKTNTASGHTYLPYATLKKYAKKVNIASSQLDIVLATMVSEGRLVIERNKRRDMNDRDRDRDRDKISSSLDTSGNCNSLVVVAIQEGIKDDDSVYLKYFYDAEVQAAALLNARRAQK